MLQSIFKKALPHLIAVLTFLIVAVLYCRPALEADVVMKQSDITHWQAMSHQSVQNKEEKGYIPLWITNMFSGMPGYQVALEGPKTPLHYITPVLELGLPKPINFFFIACLSFYILGLCLRVRSWVGIIGALAFAYCTYSPIIISAGHETKMIALAWSPAVIGGIILLYDKKYFSGFVVTMLFAALQIAGNHQQISYYLLMIIAIMSIFYLVDAVRNKKIPAFLKSAGLGVAAGAIGLSLTAVVLLPVYDFTKESKRGGQLVMNQEGTGSSEKSGADNKTKGLSKEYAFQWSYGKAETMSLMFPGVLGYGTHFAERDGEYYLFPKLDENSHFVQYFTSKLNVPEDQAINLGMQTSSAIYWGDQPFTNGPVYLGALVCFLFVFAMFYLDNKHKWWILTASLLGILMAWGSNLESFNYFLFDYLPLYNKFRAPSMTLVIPQLLFPIAAILAINKLIEERGEGSAIQKLKSSAIFMAGVFVVAAGMYISFDYSKENKERTTAFNQAIQEQGAESEAKMKSLNSMYPPKPDNQLYESLMMQSRGDMTISRGAISALKEDRQGFFAAGILRALLFVSLGIALIFLFIRKKISAPILIGGMCVCVLIDLLPIDSNYLNKFSFDSKYKYEQAEFNPTDVDRQLMSDKDPNFRVYNTAGLEESRTSYYHKSIGGYHPAKVGIYDDLIAYQLSGSPNRNVLNMLNAKYFIGKNPETGAGIVMPNPEALGNCWFVKGVVFVKGAVEEMKALNSLSPKDTAVIDESFKAEVGNFSQPDSLDEIKQTTFSNDTIQYVSNTKGPRLAVFSEVFYKDWKAYIDGKPASVLKANYVLRALMVPAGKHTIEFRFEPRMFLIGKTATIAGSWIFIIALVAFLVFQGKKYKKEKE